MTGIPSPESPPPAYDRPPTFDSVVELRDVAVPMRDGVHLCVDVFHPETNEPVPALLAFAIYNKDLQGPGAIPAAARLGAALDGPARSGRHPFLHGARLRARDRVAARVRQLRAGW